MWRLSFDCRSLPIFSKAGCSDAAANTVNDAGAGPSPEPPHEVTNTNAPRASTRLITRQLNLNVGRLDEGDCGHAGFEVELVDRLTRQQRDEAMRAGLDLDLRRDAVLDHARDDAREPIAGGLLDGLIALGHSPWPRNRRQRLACDETLSPWRAHRDEPAVVDHAAHGIDADPEHLGRLPEPIARHCAKNASSRELMLEKTPPHVMGRWRRRRRRGRRLRTSSQCN